MFSKVNTNNLNIFPDKMIGLNGLGIDLVIIFAVHFCIGDSSCSDIVECVSPFKSARMSISFYRVSIDYDFYIYI